MLSTTKLVAPGAAAAALVLAFAGAGVAAENGPYPIWWSPSLQLDSLDDIEAELDAPFPSGGEVVVTNLNIEPESYFDEARGEFWLTNQETADTCRSLIKLTAEGYDSGEYNLRTALGPRCYALEALRRARPARISYLRDFVFDESAIRYLPAMLGPLGNCGYLRDMLEANRLGRPWAPFPDNDPSYGVGQMEAQDRDTLIVKGKQIDGESRWVSTIEIQGRGDFNGDGLDDLLVRTEVDDLMIYSWGSRLFLLTRTGPLQTLRVVWEYGVLPTIYSGCRYGGYDLAIPRERPFAKDR